MTTQASWGWFERLLISWFNWRTYGRKRFLADAPLWGRVRQMALRASLAPPMLFLPVTVIRPRTKQKALPAVAVDVG